MRARGARSLPPANVVSARVHYVHTGVLVYYPGRRARGEGPAAGAAAGASSVNVCSDTFHPALDSHASAASHTREGESNFSAPCVPALQTHTHTQHQPPIFFSALADDAGERAPESWASAKNPDTPPPSSASGPRHPCPGDFEQPRPRRMERDIARWNLGCAREFLLTTR